MLRQCAGISASVQAYSLSVQVKALLIRLATVYAPCPIGRALNPGGCDTRTQIIAIKNIDLHYVVLVFHVHLLCNKPLWLDAVG
jgi:hypothetical protein